MIDNDKNQENNADAAANNEETFVSKIYTQSKNIHIHERIDAAVLSHAKTHLATKTVINKRPHLYGGNGSLAVLLPHLF